MVKAGTVKACKIAWFVIGALLLAAGIAILIGVIPFMFKQNLMIHEGSMQYENWYEPDVPVYMQWYVFNLTNMVHVQDKTQKPRFNQLGPYTYREHRKKVNITWHDNGTVTYQNLRWWTFIEDMSNGTENDTVISLNLPFVTVAEALRYESFLMQTAFSMGARAQNESVYKTYTMKELIWGYHDPLMKFAERFAPDWFYTDLVGVYAGKNNSDDGVWTVYTGENDMEKLGETAAYNGSKYLNFWSSDYANMVNGTDGTISHPALSKEDTIYFFVPDLCRSLYAVYFGTEKTSEEIELYRFSSPQEELQNATTNPNNQGFCTPQGNCLLGAGLINLTICQSLDHINIPVIASLPHFLYADPQYLAAVEGLNPVEEEHRTDICIEPKTGLVMRVAKRLQINMYLRPVDYVWGMGDVPEIVFPIAWLNESANIDKPNQDKFISLMGLLKIGTIGSYAIMGIGSALLVVITGTVIYSIAVKKKENYSKLNDETEPARVEDIDS